MGLFGPPNIGNMKSKRDVKGLIKALKYKKSQNVREAAAETLGNLNDAQAVNPLITALKDINHNVQVATVKALGKLKDARAVEPLCTMLKDWKDDDWRAPRAAAKVLGDLGDMRAVKTLIDALSHEQTCFNAAEALGKLNKVQALGERGAPAVEPLNAMLKEHKFSKQETIFVSGLLGDLGDERAVEGLSATLLFRSNEVRRAAEQALRKLCEAQVVENILREKAEIRKQNLVTILSEELVNLGTGNPTNRCCDAAIELGSMGDVRAVMSLNLLLSLYDFECNTLPYRDVQIDSGTLKRIESTYSADSYKSVVGNVKAQAMAQQGLQLEGRMISIINVFGDVYDAQTIKILKDVESYSIKVHKAVEEALKRINMASAADKKT